MASPDQIRKALMALMGAKKGSQSANEAASAALPRTVNNQPTFKAKEVADDRLAMHRQQAEDVQGVDPLAETATQNLAGQRAAPDNFEDFVGGREPAFVRDGTHRDPARLPGRFSDQAPNLGPEVPGSNEAVTLFETVMQGNPGPETEQMLRRLAEINPDLHDIAQKNLFGSNIPGADDIPF
jgi:hypothetical protein